MCHTLEKQSIETVPEEVQILNLLYKILNEPFKYFERIKELISEELDL